MGEKTLGDDTLTAKQKNTILITIMMGCFLTTLTQMVLTSALPSIMSDFNVSANKAQWLTTAYMLVLGVMIPATPYMINRFTTRVLFISSMVFFFAGCVLSICAKNFEMMIISRVLQAICGGINMQLVQILMMRMYPVEERGTAMGLYGFIIGVAPAIGPTLAGVVIDLYEWKTLFYILGIIALIDVVLALVFLKNIGETRKGKLDVISLILSSIGFSGLLIGVSNIDYLAIIIGMISLIIFTIRQLKIEKPLLNLRVFKSKTFTISIILITIIYAAMTSSSMLVSLYMQSMRGYSALSTGLLMLPGSILMSIFSPIAGKAFDKYGGRKVIIPGFAMLGLGTLAFSYLGENTSIIYLTIMYALRMIGIAFVLMTVTTWGVNDLSSKDISSGSAIGSTLRQISGSIGSAIFMSIMSSVANAYQSTMPQILADIKGLNSSFFASAILILVGLVLAIVFMKDNKVKTEDELEIA